MRPCLPLFRWGILVTLANTVYASTPNIIVSINGVNQTWLAKRALFGSGEKRLEGRLVHSPAYDEFLCDYYEVENHNVSMVPIIPPETWVMMVPRGGCTFERKAYAAMALYGASGILIYDNLSARYLWDNDTQKMTYPQKLWDYDCDYGYGFVSDIELDPPGYSREVLDPIMDQRSPTTRCIFEPSREPCASQLCLVIGPPASNTSKFPVCCAWDLPMTMPGDDTAGDTDNILAVFLTIRQGQEFMQYVGEIVVVEARPHQPFNPSMIFLWMLAVTIAFVSAYFGAADFRIFRLTLAQYQATKNARTPSSPDGQNNDEEKAQETQTDDDDDDLEDLVVDLADLRSDNEADDEAGTPDDESLDNDEDPIDEDNHEDEPEHEQEPQQSNTKQKKAWALHSLPPKDTKESKKRDEVWVLHSLPPPERKPKAKRKRPGYKAEHTAETDILPTDGGKSLPEPWATPIGGFEMTQWHVFGFVILASAMLFLLFYFKFYHIIFIFYGFGCAGAVSLLIFGPMLVRLIPKFGDGVVQELNKSVLCGLNGFDITSQLMGYIWAIVWIWFGLTHYRPSTNAFFWITIDVFGGCFCILALSMMKLNSIMIASMLLVAVFCYDIFFVFLTPLFMDGQSVMITVAKGGGGDSTADDFCYRYPDDKDCTGIDFLPMLLIIPRINDYMNGSVLLGLGDIVLPGYLIVFCARLDEAKLIIGKHTKTEMDYPDVWYKRYFVWIMVAYGTGLIFAFLAFSLTGLGQPALLYLVPCCLGTMVIKGRHEIRDLWKGSRAIKLATKVKIKHERAWGKEKMRRQVEAARQRRENGEQQEAYRPSRSGFREPDPPVAPDPGTRDHAPSGGRGGRDGGRGRERGRGSGRGRGGRSSGRGRGRGHGLENQKSLQRSNRNADPQQTSLQREATESTISSTLNSSTETKCKPTKVTSSPGSPRRRYTATLDGSPSPRKSASSKVSARSSLPSKPDLDGPKNNDICFGDKKCVGTKHLRTVVKHELKSNALSDFSPTVLQGVLKKLEGRKFFVSDGNDGWREASMNETSKEISKVYRGERSKLQEKASTSKGNENEDKL